ncbi:MAG TPA: cyclase family protein [Candidatus Acidoferrales bacterium]|nr:cyclase family protein [Candidatus Acidoferrales bacterium]
MRRNSRLLARIALTGLFVGFFVIAFSKTEHGSSRAAIDASKVVDLTYSFDANTIYWPTAKSFDWQKESWGISPGGYWYAAARYAASEHGGTHIDSPIHFGKDKVTTDEIPLVRLMGPAAVIDISDACAQNSDYRLSVADITSWEKQYGPISDGAIVLVHTRWGKFWPDKKRYLGSDAPGDTAHLHFPGLSREAAEFLVTKRKINGVGIDTASMDYGPSKDFIVHQIINGANIYGLENVANLEQVPRSGATLIVLPMKIKGGTGAPTRIIAILH